MNDKEPIKITLDDLADEAPSPSVAPVPPAAAAAGTTQKVTDAAKDTAAKVSGKLAATAADATNRTAEMVRDKVGEVLQEQSKAIADAVEQRVREIDWKTEAQKGAEGGLRRLSGLIEQLADRLRDQPPSTPSDPPTPPKP
jgi:hypothetical protein